MTNNQRIFYARVVQRRGALQAGAELTFQPDQSMRAGQSVLVWPCPVDRGQLSNDDAIESPDGGRDHPGCGAWSIMA